MQLTSGPLRPYVLAAMCLTGALAAAPATAAQAERVALKVCADPHNLPTSNEAGEGYENRIAELFGRELGLPVQYEWFPQRIGFIRNTLRNNDTPDESYKCDLVMGVPDNFELAATTRPYYRSVWVMAYARGRGLDDVKSPQDLSNLPEDRRSKLRLGLFDKSPATEWVFANGMVEQIVPYQIMTGDPRAYPGQIIERDLAQGKIDVAFVWGPIGGYFARKVAEPEIVVLPMPLDTGIKFDYQIAMAVRYGEKQWKERLNALIEKNAVAIKAILEDYGVPLLPVVVRDPAGEDDDD
ncbi:MAG: quinoprotein dehydrogenase-associated putative ABC transporter substrate-binding protein [Gammaproteobacteria bacterium]|nr:quinoprotein dehydrogenase-associated putative ABC transporter substrate-binding protein [Gammaproteobacteria bacterium]